MVDHHVRDDCSTIEQLTAVLSASSTGTLRRKGGDRSTTFTVKDAIDRIIPPLKTRLELIPQGVVEKAQLAWANIATEPQQLS